jgi:hypothetical protein
MSTQLSQNTSTNGKPETVAYNEQRQVFMIKYHRCCLAGGVPRSAAEAIRRGQSVYATENRVSTNTCAATVVRMIFAAESKEAIECCQEQAVNDSKTWKIPIIQTKIERTQANVVGTLEWVNESARVRLLQDFSKPETK